MSYIIVGPRDVNDDEQLYWSDDDGWVGFDSATRYQVKEGRMPLESVGWEEITEITLTMSTIEAFEVLDSIIDRAERINDTIPFEDEKRAAWLQESLDHLEIVAGRLQSLVGAR
jgi:hypothetical protein